jgi:hypothetical protein
VPWFELDPSFSRLLKNEVSIKRYNPRTHTKGTRNITNKNRVFFVWVRAASCHFLGRYHFLEAGVARLPSVNQGEFNYLLKGTDGRCPPLNGD